MWQNASWFLKRVDTKAYNNCDVWCFVSAGHTKFLLLMPVKNKSEDTIKTFFWEVYELYLKVLMNPFYEPNSTITSSTFHQRVKGIINRKLY
mmetsp:Transcript_22857/g.25431  ORF Transcript_22857/g.25431 Transcript_22857/m.25431 type:complete len:92 (+) Transcript_22857:1-276(+)